MSHIDKRKSKMPECDSCGGTVESGERECPYCGASMIRHVAVQKPGTKDTSVYTLRREPDGRTSIDFGDGVTGARPPSGSDNLEATYRAGGESKGSIACPKCGMENPSHQVECEACGAPLRKPSSGRLMR
jgi:predicted RNA-binding Zn-ribbon protein involved in translation (DUF1610 family)